MIQDLRNKLEAKIDKLQKTMSKEIQDLRIKQAEMQNTIKKLIRSNQQWQTGGREWISKVEDRLVEITNVGQKTEKILKRNDDSLRELWDVKHTNICIIGVPEREEREKGPGKIFEEIIAENFPDIGRELLTQIQEAQLVPHKIGPRRNPETHINPTDQN